MKMNRILSDRTVPVYRQAFPTAKSEWLRNVYYIESPDADVFNDIENELKGNVDLVELLDDEFRPTAYTPNDYNILPVDYYDLINARDAWEIVKDIPKITIGIIDNYFDTAHVDLKGQFVNTIANNNSSYYTNYFHGTAVSGLIAAIPDNQRGFPGLGFGMKLYAQTPTAYPSEYEVLQMAQLGCRVINCSWASTCEYSKVQDSIYAEVLNAWDCAVVCGAGNHSSECGSLAGNVYPASYSSNISVTSIGHTNDRGTVKPNGSKLFWKDCHEQTIGDTTSTHHHNAAVDICAPGYGLWTTYPMGHKDGNYNSGWGTSFAAPLVSATIGLVLSINPCLLAKEAADLVLNTSDPIIYDIPENARYIGKLGKGRLDVYQAVLAAVKTATEHIKTATNYNTSTTVHSNYAIHAEAPVKVLRGADVTYKARREVSVYDLFEVADGASFSIYTGMDLPTACK